MVLKSLIFLFLIALYAQVSSCSQPTSLYDQELTSSFPNHKEARRYIRRHLISLAPEEAQTLINYTVSLSKTLEETKEIKKIFDLLRRHFLNKELETFAKPCVTIMQSCSFMGKDLKEIVHYLDSIFQDKQRFNLATQSFQNLMEVKYFKEYPWNTSYKNLLISLGNWQGLNQETSQLMVALFKKNIEAITSIKEDISPFMWERLLSFPFQPIFEETAQESLKEDKKDSH